MSCAKEQEKIKNKNKNRGGKAGPPDPKGKLQSKKNNKKKEKQPSYAGGSSVASEAAKRWMEMIIDPMNAETIRSPAGTSGLCSKAKFVESHDITYADTLNGEYSIIARPSAVWPLMIAKSPARYPPVGNAELSGKSILLTHSNLSADPGFPTEGVLHVSGDGTAEIAVALRPVADAALTTHQAFPITCQIANITAHAVNEGKDDHYVQSYLRADAGNWVATSAPVFCPAKSGVNLFNATLGGVRTAVTLVICTKAGVPTNPAGVYTGLSLSITFNGFVQVGAGDGSVHSFVKRSLIDSITIENVRITAMCLLVTNMAAATHDGGEIVIGNTRQSTIFGAKTSPDLMNRIKKLPEANRWHSGRTAGGGFCFYAPDDFRSYEPGPLDQINFDDNALAAAGILDVGGSVRVIATYVVEFYTRSELFERAMGPIWNDQYKLTHAILQKTRMASGNEDHESMIENISKKVGSAWDWAWAHKAQIEVGANVVYGLAMAL